MTVKLWHTVIIRLPCNIFYSISNTGSPKMLLTISTVGGPKLPFSSITAAAPHSVGGDLQLDPAIPGHIEKGGLPAAKGPDRKPADFRTTLNRTGDRSSTQSTQLSDEAKIRPVDHRPRKRMPAAVIAPHHALKRSKAESRVVGGSASSQR